MKISHYDAFAIKPNKGNPAGVVLDANNLTDEQMQETAKKVGFNETSFVLKSLRADIQIRYFTPGHEMNLCGHGTMAALVALYENDEYASIKTVETKGGIIDVKVTRGENNEILVSMDQFNAQFVEYNGDISELAKVIGIGENEIDMNIPIVYGSTGIWTLLIPIKELSTFSKMKPNNQAFPKVLLQNDHASIHPFCLQTYDKNATMHGRHFSSAFSGTIEDPTTGTASGVMGAYYLKYISKKLEHCLIVEQGHEINKDGKVTVNVKKVKSEIEVEIEGSAVFVKNITIE